MKPRKFERKLALNKKTITNLNTRDLGKLHGGGPITFLDPTCPEVCDPTRECSIGGCTYTCGETCTCIPGCSVRICP
jgi:hypothetical protein